MLNGQGGVVLFGVTSKGDVFGQQASDKTLEDVTQAFRDIHPMYPPSASRGLGERGAMKDDLHCGDLVAFRWGAAEVHGTVAEVYGPKGRRLVVIALNPPRRWERGEDRVGHR